jgi:hypothetical protein
MRAAKLAQQSEKNLRYIKLKYLSKGGQQSCSENTLGKIPEKNCKKLR